MAGLPDRRRDPVGDQVKRARRDAEAAFAERLTELGIRSACGTDHRHVRDCFLIPLDRLRLDDAAADVRTRIEAALEREAVGFSELMPGEATGRSVQRYVRGAAYTLINRFAALRAMEVRGLIDETVVPRPQYGDRSLREFRLARAAPGTSPDEIRERALREAFAEAARELRSLFDPDDPYELLLPRPRALRELVRIFGERITEDDWKADDILGWVYQYYQDESREIFREGRGRGRRGVADADDLAAINCLYTPHWVVRVLVDNTLGRLLLQRCGRLEEASARPWSEWELLGGGSADLVDACRYLVPMSAPSGDAPARPLREIKVLDPACGSGHFLLYAFELLWHAYRAEEPDVAPEEHAATILERNLFGIDIDLRACELAALGLYLKAKEVAPGFRPRSINVVCADVRILDGDREAAFLDLLGDDRELRGVAERLLHDLANASTIGSLLRVREPFEAVFRRRSERAPGQERFAGTLAGAEQMAPILEGLRRFEAEVVERGDVGARLFALDAERSVGLVSVLGQRYDVVLMNPPYNKRQELPPAVREYLAERYGRTQHNLYAAFVDQTVDLCVAGGTVGMLTPLSYLYLTQFRDLRSEVLLDEAPPELVLELGWGVLRPAQIQTAAAVLRKATDGPELERTRVFLELPSDAPSEGKERRFAAELAPRKAGGASGFADVPLTELAGLPGATFAFWAPPALREAFRRFPPLDRDNAGAPNAEKIADVKVGLQTSDDTRFLRRWWEVPRGSIGRGKRWAPFVKGEEYARWYHDPSLVVLWEDNGRELREFERSVIRNPDYYFREGLTWQLVNVNRRVRTRYLPPGCIFAHMGPSIFLEEEAHTGLFGALGVLNSSIANVAMLTMTPERRWEVGQVSRLPIAPAALRSPKLAAAARELHDLLAAWDTGRETSSRFVAPRLAQVAFPTLREPATGHPLAATFAWPSSPSWQEIEASAGDPDRSLAELLALVRERAERLEARIEELEAEIDREVFACYGLGDQASEITDALERRLGLTVDEGDTDGADPDEVEASEDEGEAEADVAEVYDLLSWYARRAIEQSPEAVVPVLPRSGDDLPSRMRSLLAEEWGEARAQRLEAEIANLVGMDLEGWVTAEYFPSHVRRFRRRPVSWLLWSASPGRGRRRPPAFACFVDFHRLTPDTLPTIRGVHVARALTAARAEAERLQRESTEARIGRARRAAALARRAADAESHVAELEDLDRALARLIAPIPEPVEPSADAPWVERTIHEIRRDGYRPDPGLGVLVNLVPLVEAGIVHPAIGRLT